MEVLDVLTFVAKILCFVIGGSLFIGTGVSLFVNGIDLEEEEESTSRLKAEVALSTALPILIAFLPWPGFWGVILPLAYLVLMALYWSKRREDMVRFRKNWREMVEVRRVFCAGVCLLVLGIGLVWGTQPGQ